LLIDLTASPLERLIVGMWITLNSHHCNVMKAEHGRKISQMLTANRQPSTAVNTVERITANSAFQIRVKCAEAREKLEKYNWLHNSQLNCSTKQFLT